MRSRILFWLMLVWCLASTTCALVALRFWLVGCPLPLTEKGHRCFSVKDAGTGSSREAAVVMVDILKQHGLNEVFTFDAGPTTQTVFSDHATVIMEHRPTNPDGTPVPTLPPNGLSLVSSNPLKSAEKAVHVLRVAGFTADVVRNAVPELGDKLVIVKCDAFHEWVLVFRRHVMVLGRPPNRYKIGR